VVTALYFIGYICTENIHATAKKIKTTKSHVYTSMASLGRYIDEDWEIHRSPNNSCLKRRISLVKIPPNIFPAVFCDYYFFIYFKISDSVVGDHVRQCWIYGAII
jgi:hypothetical protein